MEVNMFSNCNEMLNWVYSDQKNAINFTKAVENVFRRNLVIIVGHDDNSIVTGFTPYKKNKKLRH